MAVLNIFGALLVAACITTPRTVPKKTESTVELHETFTKLDKY